MNHLINNLITALNNLGGGFCDFAGSMFIQAGVLIVALLIIDLLIRKRVRATCRYWMWMLVFVKLVLPPTLSLPTGIGYWLGGYFAAAPQSSDVAQLDSAVEAVPSAIAQAPYEAITPAVSDSPGRTATGDSSVGPGLNALTWQGILFGLWTLGVLVITGLLVQRIFFVRRLMAQSELVRNGLAEMLDQCRQQLGLRRNIQLRLSHNVGSPAVCGLFHPAILIPKGIVEKLSREKLRAVLIHELAHIKRGDLRINCVQTLLQIAYFYNPFVWLANMVVRRIREQAVDEMVLVALGAEAGSYSNTLIDIAEMAFSRPAVSLQLVGVVESKKALSGRIRHMLNRPLPNRSKLGVLGAMVIVIIAAVLLPMAKAQKKGLSIVETGHSPAQFRATLPDGVVVELVGVCEHPSEGKQWWRPDGTMIEDDLRPYAFKEFRSWYLPLNQQENKILELAVKITDSSNRDVGMICSGATRTFVNCRDTVWGGTVEVGKEPGVRDFKIGVAPGAWITLASSESTFGRRRRITPGIVFTEAYNTQKGYAVVTVTHKKDIQKENWQVVAIDEQGNAQKADFYQTQGIGEFEQNVFHFKGLRSDQIRRFEFQTRPYKWVTFKNVSLRSGVKTDVQIEVEGARTTLDSAEKATSGRTETPRLGVRAIMHGEGRRFAVIGTRVLQEGDEILGATVATINPDNVVFEKDGRRWTQEVERPDVLRVPSEMYPTIRSAVDAAKDGDTVVLQPGAKTDVQVEVEAPAARTEQTRVLPVGDYALGFDGIDDFLEIHASESLKIGRDFTIQMWIKPEFPDASAPDNERNLLSKGGYINEHPDEKGNRMAHAYGFSLNLRPKEGSTVALDMSTANGGIYTSTIIFPYGSGWLHLAIVSREGGGGASQGINYIQTGEVPYQPAPNSNIIVGGNSLTPMGNPFKGQIAELRIWNRALDAGEIEHYKTVSLSGDEPNLVGCWTFEQGQGQRVHDLSRFKNDASLGSSYALEDSDPVWVRIGAEKENEKPFNTQIEGQKTDGQVEAEESPSLGGKIGFGPVDFEGYFEDNISGGQSLEQLWNDRNKDLRDADEILVIVRKGLRRYRGPGNVLRWIGNLFIWGKNPQNPKAIELMYHASGSPERNLYGDAIYFGLSVTDNKTPEILRAMTAVAMKTDDYYSVTGRILWGCRNQKEELIACLEPYLNSDDTSVRQKAQDVKDYFMDSKTFMDKRAKQHEDTVQQEYGAKLGEFKDRLLNGSSQTRLDTLNQLNSKGIMSIVDESFLDAFEACTKDSDPQVRTTSARMMGNKFVWSADPQNRQAIKILTGLLDDPDRSTRYAAVYYGLSTVRDPGKELVGKMLATILDDREINYYGRVIWGTRRNKQACVEALKEWMDQSEQDSQGALKAYEIYEDVTAEQLPQEYAKRFAGQKSDVQVAVEADRVVLLNNLKHLALAAFMYAEDHNGSLPEKLDEIKNYVRNEKLLVWMLENVEYLGKGATTATPASQRQPMAYYRTLLEKETGTAVVFLDGHVEFVKGRRLQELGIKPGQ